MGVVQVLTALSTRFLLRQRLNRGQWTGIALIVAGLGMRALPAGGQPGWGLHAEQWAGVAMVLVSACLYTVVGVLYEKLAKGAAKPPPHTEVLWHTSKWGERGGSGYMRVSCVRSGRPSSPVLGRRHGCTGVGARGARAWCHMTATGLAYMHLLLHLAPVCMSKAKLLARVVPQCYGPSPYIHTAPCHPPRPAQRPPPCAWPLCAPAPCRRVPVLHLLPAAIRCATL